MQLHIEFKSDKDAESCLISQRYEVICCAIEVILRKHSKDFRFIFHLQFYLKIGKRRPEIHFSSESLHPQAIDFFAMRQHFWTKNKQKNVTHSEVTMMSRHGKFPQKQKWSSKNEFSIFEAGSLIFHNLNDAYFPKL